MQVNENQFQERIISINDEINISDIFKSIKRQKNIFFIITFLSILISSIYALGKKEIWQGEFQIVIENKERNASQYSNLNSDLLGLINLGNPYKNNLLTQVKILESPSVLMDPFKFVKNQKRDLGIDVSKLKYRGWFNKNLNIKLFEKTSVLKISYLDENKNLIIPALNKISSSYKKYSVREKENSIDKSLNYFEGLLLQMQKESKKSMIEYQKFSSKYNMGNIDNIRSSETESNEIKENNATNNISERNIERYKDSFLRIRSLEELLLERKTIYKEGSLPIKRLKKKIQNYKKSIARPQEIIVKHRELERKAIRDENILALIENQLLNLKFDKAKELEPWELVSKPTLFDESIGPSKKLILMFGGLCGLFLGTLSALIYEKYKGIIFNKDVFINNFKYPLLKTFYLSEKETWDDAIKLLLNGSLKINSIERLGLLRLNADISDEEEYIYSKFRKEFKNKELVFTSNLIESINCEKQIIIASAEKITEDKLFSLKESLILQGVDILGWIYIE